MATKSRLQRYFDIIRGKRGWGAVVNLDELPYHYGHRYIYNGEEALPYITRLIESGRPGFLGRPGRTELKTLAEFLNRIHNPRPAFSEKWSNNISVLSGFINPTDHKLTRFCCEMLTMFGEADIFAAYGAVRGEQMICEKYLHPDAIICDLGAIWCLSHNRPWTASLAGKKVLIVHPFVDTIRSQYAKREKLHTNPDVLPDFELKTVRAIQSSAKASCDFSDWFVALDHMKAAINTVDFDIALIAAGAYAFHLAHHCKTIGKVGIQVASFGQLLFGIYGSRWVDASGKPAAFINEHWVKPSVDERPANAELVEGACYW